MSELKPCPFCGGEAMRAKSNSGTWSVICPNCDTGIFRPRYKTNEWNAFDTEAEAIAAWNTRAGGYCAYAQPTDLTDGCALLRERTCRFIDDSDGEFTPKCSVCGYEPSIYECSWLGDGGYEFEGNYCPNCGAKVVGE